MPIYCFSLSMFIMHEEQFLQEVHNITDAEFILIDTVCVCVFVCVREMNYNSLSDSFVFIVFSLDPWILSSSSNGGKFDIALCLLFLFLFHTTK